MEKFNIDQLAQEILDIEEKAVDTYPLRFKVKNGQSANSFEVGLFYDKEGMYIMDEKGTFVISDEQKNITEKVIKDFLVGHCKATDKSKIYILDSGSFNGNKRYSESGKLKRGKKGKRTWIETELMSMA